MRRGSLGIAFVLVAAALMAVGGGCRKQSASTPVSGTAATASASTKVPAVESAPPPAPLLPLDEGNRWELRGNGAELVWEVHRAGDPSAKRWVITSTLKVGGREEKSAIKLAEQDGWLWYEELPGPRGPLSPGRVGPEGGVRLLPVGGEPAVRSWSASFPSPETKPDDIVGYFGVKARKPLTTPLGPTNVCMATQEWSIGFAQRAKKANSDTLRFAEGVGLLSYLREVGPASGDAKPFDVKAVRARLSGRDVDLTAPAQPAPAGESAPKGR
jgi:hypothetical protein